MIFLPSRHKVRKFGNALMAATTASEDSASLLVFTLSSTTASLSTTQSKSCMTPCVRIHGHRCPSFSLRVSTRAVGSHRGSSASNTLELPRRTVGDEFKQKLVQSPFAVRSRRHDLHTTPANLRRLDIATYSRMWPRHSLSTTSNAPVPSRSSPSSITARGGGACRATAASRASRVGFPASAAARRRSSSSERGHFAMRCCSGTSGAASREVRAFFAMAVIRCEGRGCCERL